MVHDVECAANRPDDFGFVVVVAGADGVPLLMLLLPPLLLLPHTAIDNAQFAALYIALGPHDYRFLEFRDQVNVGFQIYFVHHHLALSLYSFIPNIIQHNNNTRAK